MKKFIQKLIPPLETKEQVTKCNKELYQITRFFLYFTALFLLIYVCRLGYYTTVLPEYFTSEITTAGERSVALVSYNGKMTQVMVVGIAVGELHHQENQGFTQLVTENPQKIYLIYAILDQVIPMIFLLIAALIVMKMFQRMWKKEIPFGGESSTSVMYLVFLFLTYSWYKNSLFYHLLVGFGVCKNIPSYFIDPVSIFLAVLLIAVSFQMKYASNLQEEMDDTV